MASGIVERYLAGEARAFFPSHPADRSDRARAVERARRPLHPQVASALEAQNASYGASAARDENLRALREGCAAVVTGQQVGLLLGPLYTVYKAASAVALARALSRETGQRVVPVFWLQTEDHDLPEVASCHLLRAQCEVSTLALPAPEQRISLAHVRLPAELGPCIERLRRELATTPAGEEHVARVCRHYVPGAGYARAFAGLLAELFEPEGLVLIDPRTPELAAAAAEVHVRALAEAPRIASALGERSAALQAAGHAAPVHVRTDSPLSFFHPDGAEGPRYRLVADGETLREVGGPGSHARSELLALLRAEPLRFSTSALLRPIVQDHLLPTAAYVGGPGEIAYFAQMAPLYAAYEMPMPLIVARARLRVIEPKARRLLDRYGLAPGDAEQPLDTLCVRGLAAASGAPSGADVEQQLGGALRAALAGVIGALPPLGHELSSAAQKTQAALEKAASRFAQKYQSALLHRNQAVSADLQRLKALLHPLDQPQERVLCFSSFAARHGERPFIERVFDAIDPWDASLRELQV